MVTTAGDTRLTKSAYEVCKPTGADVVAAGWEGCSGARLIPRLCPLHAVKEKATRTRLARMFTREFAPFKRPIVISSLFLESQFSVKTSGWAPVNTFGYTRPLPTHRRRKLVTVSKRFFNRGWDRKVRSLDSTKVRSVYRCVILRRSKSWNSLDSVQNKRCRPTL